MHEEKGKTRGDSASDYVYIDFHCNHVRAYMVLNLQTSSSFTRF
jgi:hypothetical protein